MPKTSYGFPPRFALPVLAVALFLLASAVPGRAAAAILYLSPASGSYGVGGTVRVEVLVSSTDQAMNAVSGALSFPIDKLEATAVSTNASIVQLWVHQPTLDDAALGAVRFEGIVPNPGYQGQGGRVFSMTFKVRAAGTATLAFSSGAVLANNGKGTNILASLGQSFLALGSRFLPLVSTEGGPLAPQIASPTHPDPSKWYADPNPVFEWNVPEGVTAVRLLADHYPASLPTVIYSPSISKKQLSNTADGVWYLHVQFRNQNGWVATAHFRFNIDTTKPDAFTIAQRPPTDPTDPTARFSFAAHDKMSGIAYYEIQLDGTPLPAWHDPGSHVYETPVLTPGKHVLIASALDAAGNAAAASATFTIDSIAVPTITEYPKALSGGEPLIVRGRALPNQHVIIWLQQAREQAASSTLPVDEHGAFSYVAREPLVDGMYALWAETLDDRGARSTPTEKLAFTVAPSAFSLLGTRIISILTVLIVIVALVSLMVLLALHGIRRARRLRSRLREELADSSSAIHRAFDTLREDVRQQVRLLERTKSRRTLTQEEDAVVRRLSADLDRAEKGIQKEVAKEIEKAGKTTRSER